MSNQNDAHEGSLLSPLSLSLSLAPPRAPPVGSAHRNVLYHEDPSKAPLTHHHTTTHKYDEQEEQARSVLRSHHLAVQHNHGTKERVEKILHAIYSDAKMGKGLRLPHPHISHALDAGDQFTRRLGRFIPIWMQHKGRDGGHFRSISDGIVTCTVPTLAVVNPHGARDFIELTRKKITMAYGKNDMQLIDLFLPECESDSNRGLVFFVHGGAWGSGMPWMYRLCAKPFLDANISVAVVGYRTYPDGNVQDQIDDLESAATYLSMKYPHLIQRPSNVNEKDWVGVSIIGHSSGAHIALLMIVDRISRWVDAQSKSKQGEELKKETNTLYFDQFIGLSGVYSISHHFDYEAGRGVEEISPMKPACAYSRKSFDYYSPAMRLQSLLAVGGSGSSPSIQEGTLSSISKITMNDIISDMVPRTLLIHGADDSTVPFTSTAEAGKIMRSCGVRCCEEHYLPNTGHPDTVMELMLGGKSRDVIMDWLLQKERVVKCGNVQSSNVHSIRSKL